MHALGVKRLYVKKRALENGSDTYTALKALIELQGIECLPTDGEYDFYQYEPGLQFDYDLDQARKQPNRGGNHIMISFMKQFGTFKPTWREPWLKEIKSDEWEPFSIISLTPRWRNDSKVDWAKVLKSITGDVVFIGFDQDWKSFCDKYGCIAPLGTKDLLEVAQIVNAAKAIYCNQSPVLTIAQSLGKEYWCEFKPYRTNTILGTKNEHTLNIKPFDK